MPSVDGLRTSQLDAQGFRLVPRRDVGGYEVLAVLGRGGAGEVFLALSEGPGGFQKLVVLKSLHAHFQEDPQVVEMFMDEARIAARLNHPNIVQTLEVGLHEDRHFIAMAYLEGVTLDRLMSSVDEQEARIPPHAAARIVAEMLSGLHYAHELEDYDGSPLNIVHRDVTPVNVSISWDGSVRLLDFGIAKASTRRANTDSGVIKGKFGYISPEQAVGAPVDRRADVWSTGVCLWEMLAGQRLFPRVNDVVTLQALVDGELPSLARAANDVPPELVNIVERALNRDPDERFQTALAMREELDAWLADHERGAARSDIADLLAMYLGDARVQQTAMLRACVGGPVSLTPTGSYSVPPSSSGESESKTEPPILLESWQVLAAAVALCAAVATVTFHGVYGGEVRGSLHGAIDVEAEPPAARETRPTKVLEPTPPQRSTGAEDSPPPRPEPVTAEEVGPSEPVTVAPRTPPPANPVRVRDEPPPTDPAVEVEAPPEEAPPEEPPPEAPPPAILGTLTLDTVPWTEVWMGGRHLGQTPIVRVRVPIGRGEFRFVNADAHIDVRRTLNVEEQGTTVHRLNLR